MGDDKDCPICLNKLQYPVILVPCGHTFCFLCVKGIRNPKKCALCREEFSLDSIDSRLVELEIANNNSSSSSGSNYHWFYEGRNGWWRYDNRTSVEIEEAHLKQEKTVNVQVAGYVYVIDFEKMLQFRHNGQSRKRKIKRELASTPKKDLNIKGVAGLCFSNKDSDSDNITELNLDEGNSSSSSTSIINHGTCTNSGVETNESEVSTIDTDIDELAAQVSSNLDISDKCTF
ncbi:unnamed protein product [Diamesa tonsa]